MNSLTLQFGNVRKKSIVTGNDFVSHMVEHIAWRLGTEIQLVWENQDWRELGKTIGKKISEFKLQKTEVAALGMIDDGSAEVSIQTGKQAFSLETSRALNKAWFLDCRCEQLQNGKGLVEMLEGLSEGLEASLRVVIGNVEDPHHTWEGVFRSVGIALYKLYAPAVNTSVNAQAPIESMESATPKEVKTLERSVNMATVRRGTAESGVTVSVDFSQKLKETWNIEVADSISPPIFNIEKIFRLLTKEAGFNLNIQFKAHVLSSSHVVMEDIGLVLGRALLEILKLRMDQYGVNGAGSNIDTPEDMRTNKVSVGVSVEGRKFCRFIPFDGEFNRLKKKFLMGQNVLDSLRSEDLDDFLDGFAGGFSAGIITHIKNYTNPDATWQELFTGLGKALKQVFEINPYRKGVPPGVKATLS